MGGYYITASKQLGQAQFLFNFFSHDTEAGQNQNKNWASTTHSVLLPAVMLLPQWHFLTVTFSQLMQYHASLWCWGFIILLEHVEDDNKGIVFCLSPLGALHNDDNCGGSGGSGGGIKSTSMLATTTMTTKATWWSKTAQTPTRGGEHSYQPCWLQLGVWILEGGNKGHLKWDGRCQWQSPGWCHHRHLFWRHWKFWH